MWNSALDEAAAAMGYEYGSEFGLAVDGHPFRTPAGLLQMPVHPYSPERASVQAEEEGRAPPSDECIIAHYRATFMRHLALGRPIHVYGHPTRLGPIATRVCGELAHLASRHGIRAWTLGDYADWLRRRERAGLRVPVHARSGAVDVRFDGEPVPLRGSGDGRFRLRSVTAGSVGLTAAPLTGDRR